MKSSEMSATLSELKHQIVKLQMERSNPVDVAKKSEPQNGLLPRADGVSPGTMPWGLIQDLYSTQPN